jgi:hypothetical protein
MSTFTMSAASAAGRSITYTANSLPTGLSISGATIVGTPTVIADSSTLLTATAATTNRTAVRTINWSITVANDVYFEYNTLLIPGASTTFVDDASTNNFAVSIFGDTKPNNTNPYTPGYYSNYFDGNGDYLTLPNNAALAFGSGDFCLEFWIYTTAFGSTDSRPLGNNTSWAANAWSLHSDHGTSNEKYTFWVNNYSSGSPMFTSTSSAVLNIWTHVAITRSGTSWRMFVNGVQEGSTVTSSAALDGGSSDDMYIGGSGAGNEYVTGYMSNVRAVKGAAVYTSNFTPSTTPLTAIANTSLLTCQSNRFIDNSTNALTITVNGNTSISSFDPFVPNNSYSTYGSGYFDGTGDYLTCSSSATNFSTSNFTIEFWVNFASLPSSGNNYNIISATVTNGVEVLYRATGNYIEIGRYAVGPSLQYAWTPSLGAWNHVAFVRSSTTVTIYINGTSVTSGTVSQDFQTGLTNIGSAGGTQSFFAGYLSDVRVVNGTAVYTSNFTPPSAPLTAIANTSLLILQNNQSVNNNVFLDNSTNNFFVTRNGNTTQGTFSPYGGNWSNYFGTSTSNFKFASNASFAIGTGNFTIQCSVNFTAWASTYQRICLQGVSGTSNIEISRDTGANNLVVTIQTSAIITYAWTPNIGQWYNIALVRSGTGSNQVVLYIDGVSVATGTSSASIAQNQFIVGGLDWASGYSMQGYISNLRYSNIARTITVPTSPYTSDANTIILTCQSNRFVDNSSNAFAVTINSTPSVQRFSPFNPSIVTPTSYSGYFDGTGDYLTTPSSATCSFGTSSLTIEGWFYLTSASSEKQLFRNGLTWPTNVWTLVYNHSFAANKLCVIASNYSQSTYLIASANSLTLNTWNHIAVVRNVNSWQIYINGVADGSSATWSGSVDGGSSSALFGVGGDSTVTSGLTWIGNISNFRAVNGTAVYTSNFTPSTSPLTAISGTQLLTCQSPTFIDNSTNNFTISAFGNSQPTQQNPFGVTSATTNGYTVSTIGGSGYFDGTGDYLTIPSSVNNSPQALPFTLECWVYMTATGAANRGIVLLGTANTATNSCGIYVGPTGTPNWYIWDGSTSTSGGAYTLNAWTHLAYVREGTGANQTKFYVNGVLAATTTVSATFTSPWPIYIGTSITVSETLTGYISNVRFVKGTALYTSNFVPPSAPLTAIQNSSLLLNMTSAGIYDAAMMNNMETVGDAKLSTAVSKFGGSSMAFDGSGDNLYSPTSINYNCDTGNFTVEMWVYISSYPGNYPLIIGNNNGSFSAGAIALTAQNSTSGGANKISIAVYDINSSAVTLASSSTNSFNTWYHVALVRNGTNLSLYRDGTSVASTTISAGIVFNWGKNGILVGGGNWDGVNGAFNGYIDDLRITKGYARYTSNFTPPTSAFPIY